MAENTLTAVITVSAVLRHFTAHSYGFSVSAKKILSVAHYSPSLPYSDATTATLLLLAAAWALSSAHTGTRKPSGEF